MGKKFTERVYGLGSNKEMTKLVGGLVDRAADLGPCDPSSIPLGEKKENKQKNEAVVGPYLKNLRIVSVKHYIK